MIGVRSRTAVAARVATAAMPLLIAANWSGAQRPVSFEVATGVAIPVGDLARAVRPGYDLDAIIGAGPGHRRLRLEASYRAFPGRDGLASLRVLGLGGSVLFEFLEERRIRPYAVAGGAVYRSRFSTYGARAENDLAASAGSGMAIGRGRMRAFAEIRFHNIFSGANDNDDSRRFVPLTAGLTIGPWERWRQSTLEINPCSST